jgi:predicted RNase H-like nuclease
MLGPGTGLRHAKKTREGRAERLAILEATLGGRIDPDAERTRLGRKVVGHDDLIDAAACLATARRVLAGHAVTLPKAAVERDERSLRMEIVA